MATAPCIPPKWQAACLARRPPRLPVAPTTQAAVLDDHSPIGAVPVGTPQGSCDRRPRPAPPGARPRDRCLRIHWKLSLGILDLILAILRLVLPIFGLIFVILCLISPVLGLCLPVLGLILDTFNLILKRKREKCIYWSLKCGDTENGKCSARGVCVRVERGWPLWCCCFEIVFVFLFFCFFVCRRRLGASGA